ncbi:hypothetical protein AAVH_31226 [Aphelenchoides avenae]|nr:hypothetical protein AAVH_31226 [Aphelenchus avenae]
MLPNGDIVYTTPTSTLLEWTHGMNNKSLSIVVTELSTQKTTKNGTAFMHVFGVNDEEEPLRISVWGKTRSGYHHREGQDQRAARIPRVVGQRVPGDLRSRPIAGDYKIKGLPLTPPDEIVPEAAWRLRIRGTVVQTFSRYMRSDLQLQVTLRSVPMVYINSFTQNTEVELVGHMRRTGNVWDFDVINWSDVRSSSSLARSNATSCNAQPTMAFTPPTPPTPRTPQTHEFSFDTPKSSRASAHPQTSVAASPPATNSFTGKKTAIEVMIIQAPYWVKDGNCWSFFASASHDGKPKAIRIVTTQMLAAFAHKMTRGERVILDGDIANTRTGFAMEASNIRLLGARDAEAMPDELPTVFSDAIAISGSPPAWHKVHVVVFSEFMVDENTNVYSGYAVVHDSAKTIHVHLENVPDEEAPRLSTFVQLDLTGLIKGDDESLEMFVDWKHAAFYDNTEQLVGDAFTTPKSTTTGKGKPRVANVLRNIKVEPSDNKGGKTRISARKRPNDTNGAGDQPHAKAQHSMDVGASDVDAGSILASDSILGEQHLNMTDQQ